MAASSGRVLVTGPTGYVGGRLLRVLHSQRMPVRAMARTPRNLELPSVNGAEVVQGDVFQPETLRTALRGVSVAFYLIHSMGAGEEFAERDAQAARNFAQAAAAEGVAKIVYLGGLGDEHASLSRHLASRQEVGKVLASTGVPVLEFRASVIIGSGSLSFEIVRALTERLPVMVAPRWVHTPAQPIAIEDVLAYLVEAVTKRCAGHEIFEIGGADVVSYGGLLREYARQRGLRRILIPVPFLSPAVSSWWLVLVTPANASVGRKLIDGVRVPTLVNDSRALTELSVRPMTMR
ncbi:MAG: NAD(P)H-binding protein, partial [Bryobacterales bacterium]|nr:NAD(P)H-binding protein [Bryobacterales bacterium]